MQSMESFANRYRATPSKKSNHGYQHEKSIILILSNYGRNQYKLCSKYYLQQTGLNQI